MAMLRRLFFCCFPSDSSLQEPSIDNVITNAVLSVQEQSREFLSPAGSAAAPAAVADASAAVPQEQPDLLAVAHGPSHAAAEAGQIAQAKSESPDLAGPAAANASGASSPGSTSKTGPGTPPLDTQGFSHPSGIFDSTHASAAVKAVSDTGSEFIGDACTWTESAAAGMASLQSESRNYLGAIEQKEAAMEETAKASDASVKQSAAAAFSVIDNAREVDEDALSKGKSAAAAVAEAVGSGELQQAEDTAAAISTLDDAGAATVDAVSNAESTADAAAKSMEESAASAAKESLAQVGAASGALQSEVTKKKATPASSGAPEVAPGNSQSADEGTAVGGASDHSAEEVPVGVEDAGGEDLGPLVHGSAEAAKKPKKKNAKKKSSKKKGKSSKGK